MKPQPSKPYRQNDTDYADLRGQYRLKIRFMKKTCRLIPEKVFNNESEDIRAEFLPRRITEGFPGTAGEASFVLSAPACARIFTDEPL
jgi:hypothetical protein